MTEIDTTPAATKAAPKTSTAKTAAPKREITSSFRYVDALSVTAFVLDLDYRVVHINKAGLAGMKRLGGDLESLSGKLVGQSFELVSKDTEGIGPAMVKDASNLPFHTVSKIGTDTIDLTISAVLDEDGKYVAALATVLNITEKVAAQAEVNRITSMVENSPTNMMFADRDFVIRYVNPASLATLTALEEHLPVKASEVVGSSLDIFHKDPGHQHEILSDPSHLPVRRNIQVGPETLDLLVSAITDKDGDYIGAMATWDVITERLKTDQALQDMLVE